MSNKVRNIQSKTKDPSLAQLSTRAKSTKKTILTKPSVQEIQTREIPHFGQQVWPPPDTMVDDEGYPMPIADYLDDSELLDNFNMLQVRIKDHLSAMRSGMNVPLPPTTENRTACAQGKLSAKSILENRSICQHLSSPRSKLPLYPLIPPGSHPHTSYDHLTHNFGCCDSNSLTCATLQFSSGQNPSQSISNMGSSKHSGLVVGDYCSSQNDKKKNHSISTSPDQDHLNHIQHLGSELAREICAKTSLKDDLSSSCKSSDDVCDVSSSTAKASSSTSSGCESTTEVLSPDDVASGSDLSSALTAELLPWYHDQLTALAHGLTRPSATPLVYNGRLLRTEAQIISLLKAFFQAGLVMGRVHALKLCMDISRTSTPVLETQATIETEMDKTLKNSKESKPANKVPVSLTTTSSSKKHVTNCAGKNKKNKKAKNKH